ncbi:MAG: PIG-L family deacetylase [Chloroflexi bacterium]|nr:PIG-L family deacetylase [Chloroflexota bacterium]
MDASGPHDSYRKLGMPPWITYSDNRLRLLAIFAHPDDESCGPGATLAMYARQGVDIGLVCGTKGERGYWPDDPPRITSRLGEIRIQELDCAARVLGIRRWAILGCRDGAVADCDSPAFERELVRWIRANRPQVMITCSPEKSEPRSDHSAIAAAATRAYWSAGRRVGFQQLENEGLPPWTPSKLYYAVPWSETPAYATDAGAPLTWLDVTPYLSLKTQALRCHATQKRCWSQIDALARTQRPWIESFQLIDSRVPCQGSPEPSLFCGIEPEHVTEEVA